MTVHTRRQLLADGVGKRGLASMHRILPAVYATSDPSYIDRCRAVTLWRPSAVISHDSAAWMWGLIDREPTVVHATIPPTTNGAGPGWVRLHRRPVERATSWRGIPVVTVERALFDVATTTPRPELDRLFDAAIDTRVDWRVVAALCQASKGRHGVVAVREQLRTCCPRTRSEVERKVARGLTARDMHLEINERIGKYYGDLVCPRARVVVEIDGREFHSEPAVFSADRIRQNKLIDDGWRVLRYSAATVNAHLDEVLDDIVRVVRKRRRSRRA